MKNNEIVSKKAYDYFMELEFDEIINDRVYIGNGKQDWDLEIRTNEWSIGIGRKAFEFVKINDLKWFIQEVVNSRMKQFKKVKACCEVIFYIQLDETDGFLKFGFVSTTPSDGPLFMEQVRFVESIDEMLQLFIERNTRDISKIDFSNCRVLTEADPEWWDDTIDDERIKNTIINAYQEVIYPVRRHLKCVNDNIQ